MVAPSDSLVARLSRKELDKVFPNWRVRAAFEALVDNASNILPATVQQLQDGIDETSAFAEMARAIGVAALALAARAAQVAEEGPPIMVMPVTASDDAGPSMLGVLERLAALERAVSQLSEGPIPL